MTKDVLAESKNHKTKKFQLGSVRFYRKKAGQEFRHMVRKDSKTYLITENIEIPLYGVIKKEIVEFSEIRKLINGWFEKGTIKKTFENEQILLG